MSRNTITATMRGGIVELPPHIFVKVENKGRDPRNMKGKEMKAKTRGTHTQGPWTAYELGNEDGTWSKWSIVHNGPIAYGGDNGKGSENSKATAQLMAAAPELLAALQWFADELPSIIRQSCPQGVPMDVARAHEVAKAAIAKARGAV